MIAKLLHPVPRVAAPHLMLRFVVPGSALLLFATLAALWRWGPHDLYFGTLRLLGFEPFRFPFLDIHAVLAAAQCQRTGIDVYLSNPCDALGRVHVYSPLWLAITPGFLDTTSTTIVGLGLDLLFILSLAALIRPATWGEVLILAPAALSPMTIYALERANADVVVFLLILAGCAIDRGRRPWRFAAYALYFFAGLLKYYPLMLLVLLGRERRRDAVTAAAITGSVLLLLIASDRTDLAKALANIPAPGYFAGAFAAVNLPFGLAELLNGGSPRPLLAILLLAALVGLAAARTRRTLVPLDHDPPDWSRFEAQCLIVGALVLIGCFFAGQNIDYRGIYFVLAMPGLVLLRRMTRSAEMRRLLAQMIAATLVIVWEPLWRGAIVVGAVALPIRSLAPRIVLLSWLGRELIWWWLISGLAALLVCYVRRWPIVLGASAALAKLAPGRRRLPG